MCCRLRAHVSGQVQQHGAAGADRAGEEGAAQGQETVGDRHQQPKGRARPDGPPLRLQLLPAPVQPHLRPGNSHRHQGTTQACLYVCMYVSCVQVSLDPVHTTIGTRTLPETPTHSVCMYMSRYPVHATIGNSYQYPPSSHSSGIKLSVYISTGEARRAA